MPSERKPENLIAWQLCVELEAVVVALTARGEVAADVDFCQRFRQAARAPAAHIADGFVRFTPREFARSLRMAISALAETRTLLERANRRHHFTLEQQQATSSLLNRATLMTLRLLQTKLRQIEVREAHWHKAKNPRRI